MIIKLWYKVCILTNLKYDARGHGYLSYHSLPHDDDDWYERHVYDTILEIQSTILEIQRSITQNIFEVLKNACLEAVWWLRNCKAEAIVITDGLKIQNQSAGGANGEDHKAMAQWSEGEKEETGKIFTCTPRSCLYMGSAKGFSSFRRPTSIPEESINHLHPIYKEEIIREEEEEPSTSSRLELHHQWQRWGESRQGYGKIVEKGDYWF